MPPALLPRLACAIAVCAPVMPAAAQSQTQAQAQAVAPAPLELDAITVTAHPLAQDAQSLATPVDTLQGDALMLQRQGTLGTTLEGLPGVHADTFGAGASRPVIRGQAAPRVQVLSDGAAVMDASGVSPDHAVVAEPMLARRIEVLRGPAALLYGGGAIGGVVNVLDDKIPEAVPEQGYEGYAELRGTTGSNERAGAFGLTAGEGSFAVHVEGMKRRSDEYRVPGWPGGRLAGSQEASTTGSVGMSWSGAWGYLGAAYTHTRSSYGLPGHTHEYEGCHPHGGHLHCSSSHGHEHGDDGDADDHHDHHDHGDDAHAGAGGGHAHAHAGEAAPYVKLESQRLDIRGEYREPFAGISKLRLRAGLTDYHHDEIDAGRVSTTFKNRGYDLRLEAEHAPIAGWRGVAGVQTSHSDFSAQGVESFLPPTATTSTGLFLLEGYDWNNWRFEAGVRQEWQSVRPDDGRPGRSDSAASLSGSAVWKFVPGYALALSLTRSQRLPNAQELYAHGVHLATNTYELGNPELGRETSRNIDLTLRKTSGNLRLSLGVFHNQVQNYIYARTLDRYEDFRLIEYAQHDARFTGVEAQADYRFNRHVRLGVFGDLVHGRLTGAGDLPRMPAARAGVRGAFDWQDWSAHVEAYRVMRQDKVADYESPTPGYNMVNLDIAYHGSMGSSDYTVYLRATNLFDQLAYNHASFIAQAAPLPGRRITLGLRLEY